MIVKNNYLTKTTIIRTESELRQRALELLAADAVLAWKWPKGSASGGLRLQLDHRELSFVVEPLLSPSARDVERLHARAQGRTPLLIAPSLSEVLVNHCRERGVSCLDLNGRLWVRSDGVIIDRHPTDRRRFRPALATLDPFQTKSSRLVRTLLSHADRSWTQTELVARTGLSPGLVSRLTRRLVNEGLVGERERSLTLLRAEALLDAWAASDDWSRRTAIQQYSLLESDPGRVAERTAKVLGKSAPPVFTQWFAANLRHPYTPPPVVSAYVASLPTDSQVKALGARRVDEGGTLWLIQPKDDGVFRETQQVGPFTLACDSQIYLDLLQVGLRGPDQAQALRDWKQFGKVTS